jgi:diguanylate cyclase (GGDEF)-like protein
MKPLWTTGIWLLAAVVLLQTGLFTPTPTAATLFYYAVLVGGLLLAWRFHSSRVFLALLVVFLAEHAIAFFSAGHIPMSGPGRTALVSAGVLLPLNFVMLSLGKERGFTLASLTPAALLLFVQSVIVAVLCRPTELASSTRVAHHAVLFNSLPSGVFLAFAAAVPVLGVRFLFLRKPIDSAFLWALISLFLALYVGGVGRMPTVYFATAALTLVISIIETSYMMAYHDELTALPSRRAFNDALLRLVSPYSIAMVDIDHFKRFNDTYGHDIGDQVLCLVASRLARVAGGGQAHRCGGEEFAILFPGKTTKEVMNHLEQLRIEIAASTFRLRGKDRREIPRGPDRRKGSDRRPARSRVISAVARPKDPNLLSVTVSIGVACSTPAKPDSATEVIQAADRALYAAKTAGRNRVEPATPSRRRVRAKAAGIA